MAAARRFRSILGNAQRLDGGAMFGNAPRALWSRWAEPDAQNRILLATRALLVEEPSGTLVLCEAGIGAFFAPELRARYGVEGEGHVLCGSLARAGLAHADIDVVVLSHLHFDHAGGLLAAHEHGAPLRLLFPRARFVVGRVAWERACAPHPRDRASFIAELPALLEASGRLEIVEDARLPLLGDDWRWHRSDGHTPGLLLAEIRAAGGPVVFASDLAPGAAWTHLPITMGYDRSAERLVDEKAALFADLADRGGSLFFTHDPAIALGRLARDDRGRYGVVGTMNDDAVAGLEL
jgi:glyoxylase-like metal-dependent hydrolase (beta-lactamase superfamily II)